MERNTAHSLKQFRENYDQGQFSKGLSVRAITRVTSGGERKQKYFIEK